MRNKRSTGRSIKRTYRIRHKGVMYRVERSFLPRIFRDDDGAFIGWGGFTDSDPRRVIDRILSGPPPPRLRPTPKRRRFGRIWGQWK